VLKTLEDCRPKPLLDLLDITYSEEPRKPGYFDNSRNKSGKQSIVNRSDFTKKILKS